MAERPVIQFKPGFRALGLKPEAVLAVVVVASAFADLKLDCVLTHGIEGVHSVGSEHYTGLAFDVRLHNVPAEARAGLVTRIRNALGADFDVLHESPGTPNEHLHVEYDPKSPYTRP